MVYTLIALIHDTDNRTIKIEGKNIHFKETVSVNTVKTTLR